LFALPYQRSGRNITWGCLPAAATGALHHLSAEPGFGRHLLRTTVQNVPLAGLNSEKSNTYSSNVVQNIIGAKPSRGAKAPLDEAPGAEAPAVHYVRIDEGSEGQRLDNFLVKLLKGVPKSHVYRVIRSGEVRVNKGRASADTKLALGDEVRVPPVRTSSTGAEAKAAAPPREFPLVFEDEHLIAIAKPAGVAVHGGSGVSFGVIEQMRQARPQARFLELVHRLDKETSGLLLVAKKRAALVALQDQLRQRGGEKVMHKTYAALVIGAWPEERKVIDVALHKFLTPDGERRVRTVDADHEDGKRSITLVKVVQRFNGFTLLDVTIKTGRTHQIRVHLAGEGHPIAGDDKYGDFALNKALARGDAVPGQRFDRMFLHARRLRLQHPAGGEVIELAAPLPAECEALLKTLPPP
jgi:23S rRNA pseudouridine955/2504/2580 synthase